MPRLNLGVRIAICFLAIFIPLQTLDQWLYDQFFRLRGTQRTKSPIVLVRVNDAKLYPFFLKGKAADAASRYFSIGTKLDAFFYRDFYHKLLAKIQAGNPRSVVFTSFFEAVDGTSSASLQYENLLFSSLIGEDAKLILPLPSLTIDDNHGFNNIFPDRDNVVRRARLIYSSGSSLALRLYRELRTETINRDLNDALWIDFKGPAGTFPWVDAADVLEGERLPEAFRNKIVLIGREGTPMLDLQTPFGKMSRLEIHANIASTFLDQSEIRFAPGSVTYTLSVIAVLVSIFIVLFFPLSLAWLFIVLFSLVIFLLSLFIFSQLKFWVGVSNPIFCVLGTHLFLLGYKLRRQEEQQWKIQQEAEYLKEMDQFKNNFISLFSHDLKTPIAKVKAITDRILTENPGLQNTIKDDLKSIDRTNSELARYISDILKVTKMESMSLEPAREVMDLNRLVETSSQRLKFLADEKQIEIVLDLEPLFSMEGDPQLIQEVITNLLENAIKYSPNKTQIIVKTWEAEKRVYVCVQDKGHGIPQDEIPRVTGKFYRGRATAEQVKGSGLGLYLAKYFVELHDGELEIKSQVGQGTEVLFSLPIHD